MSTLSRERIEFLSECLEFAETQARPVDQLTDDYPGIDLEDAYAIQWATRRRKEARGNRIIGLKVGLTSRPKMTQMAVHEPIYGFLADYFQLPEGGRVGASTLIHPRVEGEIAFVTKAPLRGPGCHAGQVLAATDFLIPSVEVIDSRYKNFRFDLASVVADNASSSRFVTGGIMGDPWAVDLRTVGVVLEKNGDPVEVGAGAAVIGNPASSVAMLANMLANREEEIPAGSLILSGGITAAVAVEAGDHITLRAQGMGSVSVCFV